MSKTLLLTSASAFALIIGISSTSFADDGARAESISSVTGNTAIDNGTRHHNLIENS
jgi:hypothetical protein